MALVRRTTSTGLPTRFGDVRVLVYQAPAAGMVERLPLVVPPNPVNRRSLATKRDRMGHLLDASLLPAGDASR